MAGYDRNEEFISKNGHEYEGTAIGQKYGGLVPKKKPLISKDHERAFFDSADWALCKQGAGINENSTIAIETLRPKLERTPRQCLPQDDPLVYQEEIIIVRSTYKVHKRMAGVASETIVTFLMMLD